MKKTIRSFWGTECFTKNRGIIRLHISQDSSGNEVWEVRTIIEDEHMWGKVHAYTPVFEDFLGSIVLITNEKRIKENSKLGETQQQEIRLCIDDVIGDRVYQRPKRQDRWTSQTVNGVRLSRGNDSENTDTSCMQKIVFYSNKSYEVIHDAFPCVLKPISLRRKRRPRPE